MRHALPLAVLTLLLSGCFKTLPPVQYTPDDAILGAPAAEVWQALTLVYTDLGIPIENMDKASWFMRSDDMVSFPQESVELFDCGVRETFDGVPYPLAERAPITPHRRGTGPTCRIDLRGGSASLHAAAHPPSARA